MDILQKYSTEPVTIEMDGGWNYLDVFINQTVGDKKMVVGQYRRNYAHLMRTFLPFLHHDKEYALYSRQYTATRVMELPSCEDIGGEDHASLGFCPVEYYVPYNPSVGLEGDFGFVAGCIWGDDTAWKIQYLDLSRITEGVLIRDDRFGYLELPREMRLSRAIDMDMYDVSGEDRDSLIRISAAQIFNLDQLDRVGKG